jgi:hypothetical protein
VYEALAAQPHLLCKKIIVCISSYDRHTTNFWAYESKKRKSIPARMLNVIDSMAITESKGLVNVHGILWFDKHNSIFWTSSCVRSWCG